MERSPKNTSKVSHSSSPLETLMLIFLVQFTGLVHTSFHRDSPIKKSIFLRESQHSRNSNNRVSSFQCSNLREWILIKISCWSTSLVRMCDAFQNGRDNQFFGTRFNFVLLLTIYPICFLRVPNRREMYRWTYMEWEKIKNCWKLPEMGTSQPSKKFSFRKLKGVAHSRGKYNCRSL